ncbi:MAG: GlcNAc-PI de-N-acetylase [Hamadaea sp.]|nr:GlcNAc-PI de-N-acetylase [Hamadaea sp.]NUR47850.1 GlcNAc-PI de-N-acetylase [Hamadaea sp.]NUT04352.1 GlcNAc-PI de-N-acetylase [Hamadaea sp.]
MAVHAHPDDEASSTGGVLARYAAEGIRTVVVTCTDGRCGDGPGGVKPGDPGHDPDAVAAVRRAELDAAAKVLGVDHLERLDYLDSGMMGWATNEAPGSFWTVPVEVAAARLAELIRRYEPDVIVTYDERGGYGHPDHIQTHRITMAAVEQAPVAKVYWSAIPRSWMTGFQARMAELGIEWEEQPSREDEQEIDWSEMGTPDEQITAWVDTTAYGPQKYDALAAHASQGENIFFLRMGKEKFTELMGTETFVRVHDTTGASTPEDDLFAGLR